MTPMVTCGVTQQMTPKCSGCPNIYTDSFSCENGDCKSSLMDRVSSTSFLALPSIDKMCSLSTQKDNPVNKRRKMDKDSNSILADDEVKETTTRSCTTSNHSSIPQNLSGLSPIFPSDTPISNLRLSNLDPVLEYEGPAEACHDDPLKASLEPYSGVNDRCSSSISSMPCLMMFNKKDAAECSSSNISATEPIASAKDLCIAILRKDGHLSGLQTRICTENLVDNHANHLLPCKTCGQSEHPLKMLICDSCEAAFHLPCCIPRVKEIPTDEWYCWPCWRKKPKSSYGKLLDGKGKLSRNISQKPPHGVSRIEYMLKDTKPYVTGVRIGGDFQARVPEWSGPTCSTDGYFEKPSELEPVKLNWPKKSNQNKPSIGNWIQCREVLNAGDSDEPIVCGKWRRAPLSVVQSDDWDCSCCVLWDPSHADCAVPQELETDEVLNHLKYVNMLKNHLADGNHGPA